MQHFAKAALLALALAAPLALAGELEERAAIREPIERAYQSGDYETIERLHTEYSDFAHKRTSSGAFKMGLLIDGLVEPSGATTEVFQRDIARTKRWAEVHPGSPFGWVLYANAVKAYGGFVRGGGYANTVSDAAWAVLHETNQRAAKILNDHREVASRTSSWHAIMIVIGRNEGWPIDDIRRVFDEGVALAPLDFRLYHYMQDALLPKWEGSTAELDAFVRDASAKAPPAFGTELYARLYSGIEEGQFPRTLYRDSLVDWPTMKAGLNAWTAHFPTTWNRNIFAYHACLAADRQATVALFKDIGSQREPEIWSSPDGRDMFGDCARWAADPTTGGDSPIAPPRPKPGSSAGGLQAGTRTAIVRAG